MFSASWACILGVALPSLGAVKHDPGDKVSAEIFKPVLDTRRHKKRVALGGPKALLFDDVFIYSVTAGTFQ